VFAVRSLAIRLLVMVRGIGVVLRPGSWFGFQVGLGFAGSGGPGFQELGQGRGSGGLPVAELVDHDQVGGAPWWPLVFGAWQVIGFADFGMVLLPRPWVSVRSRDGLAVSRVPGWSPVRAGH
jgi:hypothetical protein